MATTPKLPERARIGECYDDLYRYSLHSVQSCPIESCHCNLHMPYGQPNPSPPKNDQWIRVAVILVVLGIALYSAWHKQPEQLPTEQPPTDSQVDTPRLKLPPIAVNEQERPRQPEREPPPSSGSPTTGRTVIPSQTIRDQDGKVVFRGDVDVGPTLTRIQRGVQLRFSHDGIVFQNRERRLPRKSANYYHEFVHPTPEIGGPGPQRIITGREGETYYTPDHYRTFQRLNE